MTLTPAPRCSSTRMGAKNCPRNCTALTSASSPAVRELSPIRRIACQWQGFCDSIVSNAHNSRRGCGPQAPTKPIANNLQKSPTSPRSRGAWRGGNNTSPVIVRMNPHARRDLAILRVNNGHRLRGKFSGEIRREYMCQTRHALPFIYSAPSQSSPYRCAELNWCVHHPNQW